MKLRDIFVISISSTHEIKMPTVLGLELGLGTGTREHLLAWWTILYLWREATFSGQTAFPFLISFNWFSYPHILGFRFSFATCSREGDDGVESGGLDGISIYNIFSHLYG